MSRLAGYRDGLDATAAPGAGPAGSVEEQAAELALQAGGHLAPLAAPHDPGCRARGREGELEQWRLVFFDEGNTIVLGEPQSSPVPRHIYSQTQWRTLAAVHFLPSTRPRFSVSARLRHNHRR